MWYTVAWDNTNKSTIKSLPCSFNHCNYPFNFLVVLSKVANQLEGQFYDNIGFVWFISLIYTHLIGWIKLDREIWSFLIDFSTEVIGIAHSLLLDILFFHWLKREQLLYWLCSSSARRNKKGCNCYSPAASYSLTLGCCHPIIFDTFISKLNWTFVFGFRLLLPVCWWGSYSLSFSCVDFFQFRFHVTLQLFLI